MKKDEKPYSILVVEDNPGDFFIVEFFLMEQIVQPGIVHAANFKEASKFLQDGNRVFDVVLLDLTLPDKYGQDLINEMLRIAALSPIIILTGYTNIDFSINSISQGIFDYLLKDDLTASAIYKSILYAIERKKIIAQLKESEIRYSDLFYLSPQPTWVFELATLRFIQVNKAAIEQYGYSEQEFLAMTIIDICTPEERTRIHDLIINQQDEPAANNKSTYRQYKKNGELITVELYSSPIIIKEKNCRSVIAIDITEKNLFELKLTKAIIKTQEDERFEIGGELHDNVCQILATCHISMGMLKESLLPPGLTWFEKCNEYIHLASKEIRYLSHRLAPVFFDDTSLEEALQRLFNSFNIQNKYKISLLFTEPVKAYPVSREIQLNLYRVIQEQLNNILKYARASSIDVDVLIDDNNLAISVADNGVGFNIDTVKAGIGLANMKRRVELISGKFTIDSSPGNGCKIAIDIPLTAN